MSTSPDWRPLIAGLANADARRVYAEVILASTEAVPPARSDRALRQLLALGLIEMDASGTPRPAEAALRAALSAAHAPRPTGPERFLDADGRIDRYPVSAADRLALLNYVVARAVAPDAVLSERQLGEALAAFTDDVAALRRALVDYELLERTPTGSEYARVAPSAPVDK